MYSSSTSQPAAVLSRNNLNISDCSVSISEIYSELSALDAAKGPGPDGLPPVFLKNCSFIISRPLFIMFNLSLKSGVFPHRWKLSFITPILKSGDSSRVENYRPISIISTIPKLFEKLVHSFLVSRLSTEIDHRQFGFMSGRSTELNVLTFVDFVIRSFESGGHVHAVYTDFSKAFDRVNHTVLLDKLTRLGLNGPLHSWLQSYLTDRRQIVRLCNYESSEIIVLSGVPQGSHLGPLLFNIFINDIGNCFLNSEYLLFADDLKFYCRVSNTDDCLGLQRDLSRLVAWCRDNHMDLNIKKCHSMIYSRSTMPVEYVYSVNGTPLEGLSCMKDLGIVMDPQISFSSHVATIVSKALQMLGFVKRCTKDFQNISSIKLLYCALVRPHLEYCSCVWSPQYNIYIQTIEQIQHKFLRYVAFKRNIPLPIVYTEFETELNLLSLQTRRRHRDLRVFYDILHSRNSCPVLLGEIALHVPARQTRQVPSFYIPSHRTNYGNNSFVTRVSRLANEYATQLDYFVDRNLFLRLLKDNVI